MATVVVTRAADDAGRLAGLVRAAGHAVLEVPTIEVIDQPGGDGALASALERAPGWVVVTSRHGAERLGRAGLGSARLAAVGRATADACRDLGLPVALVPERYLATALVDEFPAPDGGWVLVVQGNLAQPTVVDGLRAAGWPVEAVTAYRTEPVAADAAVAAALPGADAITFTSGSTVSNFVAAYGAAAVPPVVVCIGPVTAEVAGRLGVPVAAVAAEHTVDGLMATLLPLLGTPSRATHG